MMDWHLYEAISCLFDKVCKSRLYETEINAALPCVVTSSCTRWLAVNDATFIILASLKNVENVCLHLAKSFKLFSVTGDPKGWFSLAITGLTKIDVTMKP